MDWSERVQVKKGSIGEKIIRDYLESKGFIVYEPITETAHGFDKLAVKNKKILIIAEVKSKSRLNKYNATGIDIRHYNEYKHINKTVPVFIFFVDEMLGKVYGNWLAKLEKPIKDDACYPNTGIARGIILFSMKNMLDIKSLSQEDITVLKANSSRNYEYLH